MALSATKTQGACLLVSNVVDREEFSVLWSPCDWRGAQHTVADKGEDCSAVRNQITASGKTPVISRKKGAICPGVRDKERYKTRSAMERFFGK